MIKVSVTKIRNTPVGKLAAMGDELKVSITGSIFIDPQPMLPAALQTLITNFTTTKANFKSGGYLVKPPYTEATKALINGLVEYAPYVSGIAKGDVTILALTPLPTTEKLNYSALILGGAVATGMYAKKGMTGQFIVDCKSFGPKVGYFAVICEGGAMPAGVTLDRKGKLKIPAGCLMNIFTSSTTSKKKTFSDLIPGVTYYVYYVLTYGADTVGFFGVPLQVICSN